MLARMVRTRWYRALAAGPILLLLALAPSVLYVDHWTEYLGLTTSQTEEQPMEHIGHCHIAPANCSDQPLPPDLSATPAVVHVVEPELTSVALEESVRTIEEHVVAPPTEPPRT
jgi:hypothetical protein